MRSNREDQLLTIHENRKNATYREAATSWLIVAAVFQASLFCLSSTAGGIDAILDHLELLRWATGLSAAGLAFAAWKSNREAGVARRRYAAAAEQLAKMHKPADD
ncbi:MAG: hypothetical protein EON59_01650 [Alphaproteobacteria bacterium]|nr:MAG: hypothetical protein EON59_01650 [Alphaproteobacteria bacterium]